MATSKAQMEVEAFIRKFGFPDSVINGIVGLKDEDNMISIPLTDKAWKRARSIISAKQVALLDAHTDEADGLNDAVNTALLYLSREPEKSIVLELAKRARQQQARFTAVHSGSTAVASGASARVVSSPVVKFTPSRSGVSLGELPPSRRVEEHKEQDYIPDTPPSSPPRVVDPLQAAFALINSLPPVRKSGVQLSPRTEYKVACRLLEMAGDYSDEVDSATGLRICAANKTVYSYLEKLKTPSTRLVKVF